MTWKASYPSRDRIMRAFVWTMGLGVAGAVSGGLLGMIVVDQGFARYAEDSPSFAGLSANPDALITEAAQASPPCPGCADSYGVAARLEAGREERMSDPFRRLGEVDVDMTPPPEPTDDYHYGGRLPDPAPRDLSAMAVPVALDAPSAPIPIQAPRAAQQKGPDETPEPSATPE